MRSSSLLLSLRPVLALVLSAAACSDTVSPSRPDGEALRTDLETVSGVLISPTAISFGRLGGDMSVAFGGGALFTDGSASAIVLPPAVVGRTFVYDTLSQRYIASARTGAPATGVRFVLYEVDQGTGAVILPLVESGWADFTRSVTDGSERIRVEAYAAGNPAVKVLDYAAGLRGPALVPTLALAGWMRNASDSLTFALSTRFDLASEGVVLDWRTALPARGILSRMRTTFSFAQDPRLLLDGSVRSGAGELGLEGTLALATGGTLDATVNGNPFAKLSLAGLGSIDGVGEFDDITTVFTRPDGAPLSPEAQQLLERLLAWFAGGFALLTALLNPMETLLSPTALEF